MVKIDGGDFGLINLIGKLDFSKTLIDGAPYINFAIEYNGCKISFAISIVKDNVSKRSYILADICEHITFPAYIRKLDDISNFIKNNEHSLPNYIANIFIKNKCYFSTMHAFGLEPEDK